MMRTALLTIALMATAAPALAELPPHVYQRARADADTVMIIEVREVVGLADGQASGTCVVRGMAAEIQRSDRYRVGDHVSIATPCIGPAYQAMPGPFPGYDARALQSIQRALVFLKNGQLVARGLEDRSPPVAVR